MIHGKIFSNNNACLKTKEDVIFDIQNKKSYEKKDVEMF